jgi:1D-myo-inositol-triphosphate 3-kinase
MDFSERNCLLDIKLNNDSLIDYVPRVSNDFVVEDNKKYTEMQDLLYGFEDACIMDIKIGTKTFDDQDDVNKLRDDLFKRLFEIDPNELTKEEVKLKAISKKRFMRWRETSTSSSTLGFRVEAVKLFNKPLETNYFKLKEIEDIKKELIKFTSNNLNSLKSYYERLISLRETLKKSSFFKTHQVS